MVAPSDSLSPSAEKPALVVTSWVQQGFPIEVIAPDSVSVEELSTAHNLEHVRAVLECRAFNGFGNRSPAIAASLPYTSGAMLSAARWALAHDGAASAPCSGFHHAGFLRSGGFCTFNGLMVTACVLKREGKVQRVGIVDCDQHKGNGTDDIIRRLDAKSWVQHFTAGATYHRPEHADRFFEELQKTIDGMADCDLILYQAGADPHIDDPLGGWLTTDQLRRRDGLVFDSVRRCRVPLAWNLAGGYQREKDGSIPKVLDIHDNTAGEWVRVFGSRGPRGHTVTSFRLSPRLRL
jgi:acetoin utilization deacetylase AcuC-like enzyme